uniref:Uncharacterized protein n=1 Tax=Salix viminalis TaxID=40686 RepID=A0A6N2KJP0_SALVM
MTSSVSSSKEEEQTNKFCLSQSKSELISKEKSNTKMEKKTTMKKSKELKRKVDIKLKKKEPQQCSPDKSVSFQRFWSLEDEIVLLKCIKIFEKVEIPPGLSSLEGSEKREMIEEY